MQLGSFILGQTIRKLFYLFATKISYWKTKHNILKSKTNKHAFLKDSIVEIVYF